MSSARQGPAAFDGPPPLARKRSCLIRARPSATAVDEFQMARVETKREMHRLARGRGPIRPVAQMILHVAVPAEKLGIIGEFAKNQVRTFAQDIGQHIQAPAMGHAQDDFFDALLRRLFDGQIQQRNQTLASFQ